MTSQLELDEYLGRADKDKQWFLHYATCLPAYQEADVASDPATPYSFRQYFSNLNNDGLMFEKKSHSASHRYYKRHHILQPHLTNTKQPAESTDKESSFSRTNFTSFVNFPTVLSDDKLFGIAYNAAVDLDQGIYVIGGLVGRDLKEYAQYLSKLTRGFTIPPENVSVKLDYDLPLPLSESKLKLLCLKPNASLYKFSPDSGTVSKLIDLDGMRQRERRMFAADERRRRKEAAYTTAFSDDPTSIDITHAFDNSDDEDDKDSLDDWTDPAALRAFTERREAADGGYDSNCPRPLLCPSVCKISQNHFIMYGGFELLEELKYPDDEHVVVERTIVVSGAVYIFDALRIRFKLVRVSVQPHNSISLLGAIPRFGFTLSSVTLEESNGVSGLNLEDESKLTKPAVVYMFGGFKLSSNGRTFVSLNDFWQCEIFWDHISFNDVIVCSSIGNFDSLSLDSFKMTDGDPDSVLSATGFRGSNFICGVSGQRARNWPNPRGFYGIGICSKVAGNPARSKTEKPTKNTQFENDFENEQTDGRHICLVIQGGSTRMLYNVTGGETDGEEAYYSRNEVLGDTWIFDTVTSTWEKIVAVERGSEVDLAICGHHINVNSRHLTVIGGCQRGQFSDESLELKQLSGPKGYGRATVERFSRGQQAKLNRTFACNGEECVGLRESYGSPHVAHGGFYRTYVLNLDNRKWSPVEFLFVKRMRTFLKQDTILTFVCGPTLQLDSKILVLGGDIRKIDYRTFKEEPPQNQVLFACNISECYTSYLKL